MRIRGRGGAFEACGSCRRGGGCQRLAASRAFSFCSATRCNSNREALAGPTTLTSTPVAASTADTFTERPMAVNSKKTSPPPCSVPLMEVTVSLLEASSCLNDHVVVLDRHRHGLRDIGA